MNYLSIFAHTPLFVVQFYMISNMDVHRLFSLWASTSVLKSLDHFRGIADGDGVGGDVMCNNRSGSYGTIIADGDAGQEGHIPADPYIIADSHGFRPFLARLTFTRIGAMTRAVDMHAGSYETIVADGDIRLVQDGKAEVREETFADADMLAVVAIERLVDERVFIRLT